MFDFMTAVIIERRVVKFIKNLPLKHQEQVKKYILNLQDNPFPNDSKKLKGFEHLLRGDCGEYRIVFRVDMQKKSVYVLLVGKRNGDEVYRVLKEIF